MVQDGNSNKPKHLILPNDDPFGISNVRLAGAPPSFEVEAEISRNQRSLEQSKRSGEGHDGQGDDRKT